MCTQERILIANELNLLLCEHNTLCCHLEIEGKHSVSQVLVFKMRNDSKGTFPISKKQLEEALIAILLLLIGYMITYIPMKRLLKKESITLLNQPGE